MYFASDSLATETTHDAGYVNVDKTAPVITPSGAPTGWSNKNVTLSLLASDGLSGVAAKEYQIDANGWYPYTTALEIGGEGATLVSYRAMDNVGNLSGVGTCTVKVDTEAPSTSALYSVRVSRGHAAVFAFRVNDETSPKCDVVIRVRTLAGITRARWVVGRRAANKNQGYRHLVSLPRGKYRWFVYAKDLAGNRQTGLGYRTLVVR